ncbi:MAG: PQQ-dependent sugar dehydrogenase, partial [Pseudomonadales bacterium]
MCRFESPTLWLALVVVLTGCGGGGGNDGDGPPPVAPVDPFGLDTRASVAPLSIPLGSGSLGSYELENAFSALSFPAAVFFAAVPGENRLAVVQQSGQLRAFDDAPDTATSQLVLDVSARISFSGERGLLGLAFDPDFEQNRYFYVYQSMAGIAPPGVNHVSRVSRFTWDAGTDTAVLASEKVILEVDEPYANHNGGMLAFG